MRVSFSTNAFTQYSIFDAVEKIAAAGYEGIELLADIPHLYADSVSVSDLQKLKEHLSRTGLRVANLNANTAVGYYGRSFWEPLFEPSLAHPEPLERQWRIDYTRKCIDMASFLGSPCVSVTSGRMVPGVLPEKSLDFLRQSLKEVAEYAHDHGIRIGIEYEPGLLVECYEELASLLDGLDLPNLGANLDLGHSHLLREDPQKVIGGLGQRIFHIHIEDIKDRKHYHLIPGRGDLDFGSLFETLGRHHYEGFITVELYTYPHQPEAAAKSALSYLRSLV
ncbi:sugar phosphate isomerase/epimerase family protein [Desulforhabdus amnigena]|uniref:AP endonuclease n=1 Tax=Desulforhabdus amnigena TaxID=40218 RepID=A0A9W6FWT5_9BACT|nr:sugar phosphate isomerase/epimerase family protein [Desulforhabdus amnigena]NLJ28574.1 sugar phosphate isomerase/epimerase [Deltaproteobacteria bacterium]GLI36325.1 AP endonuclease [Desulforhabdus amnigena]